RPAPTRPILIQTATMRRDREDYPSLARLYADYLVTWLSWYEAWNDDEADRHLASLGRIRAELFVRGGETVVRAAAALDDLSEAVAKSEVLRAYARLGLAMRGDIVSRDTAVDARTALLLLVGAGA